MNIYKFKIIYINYMEEIHKCYINCFNILKYRGFNVYNLKNISYNNFEHKFSFFSNNPNILDIYVENKNKKILFHFIKLEKNLSNKYNNVDGKLDKIYNNLLEFYSFDNNKEYEIIFIVLHEISNDIIKDLCDKYSNLTIFYYKHIIVDIMKHKYVPKHIIINDKEKNKLKKELKLNSLELLPYISKYDPVSKIIGVKYGDICKIIRNFNANVGESIYYRYCNLHQLDQ
tara:strand:+ start:1076 stop:1762 length:687 start_codon:yes stop_codon:yes gene_type:complete